MNAQDRLQPGRGALVTALLTVVCSLALMWSVVLAPMSTIASDVGDPLLNAAILQWNATRIPLTAAWWNFPAYAPADGVTTFTEHLLGLWPLASPIVWLTGSAVLAYNVTFFLSFVLSALAMYALVRWLTGSEAGAAVAAIAFTFNTYRGSQFAHLQMMMTWGMPLALLGLHRHLADGRVVWLLLFGAGWLITALSNGYFMIFFAVYLGCWVLWFCSTRDGLKRVPGIAVAGVGASLPLAPILLEYLRVHAKYGFVRSIDEIRGYAADVSGLFRVHPAAVVARRFVPTLLEEGALFSGFTILALAAAGAVRGVTRGSERHRYPWLTRAAFAGTLIFLAATIVAMVTDVRITIPFRMSISRPHKPLTGFFACLVIWMATSRRMRAIIGARDVALFYAGTAVLMWLFSLGPEARLWGDQVLYQPPYAWLLHLPGVDGLRVPARFWMLALLSLSVLAGYAVASIKRQQTAMAAALTMLLLVEGWMHIAAAPIPEQFGPKPSTPDAVVMELPIGNVGDESAAEFRAVRGGYRVVNGYSGHTPPHIYSLELGLRVHDTSVLDELRQITPVHVSVIADNSDGYRRWLVETQKDAKPVSEGAGRVLYFLSKLPPRPRPLAGEPLTFTVSDASCSIDRLNNVVDGSLTTRWDCGVAQPGQQIAVDFEAPAQVSGVCLTLGPFSSDTPRGLLVEVSDDGATWRTAWSGPTAGFAFRAAVEDPRRSDVRIGWTPVVARHLRLTQTGEAARWYWSIAELALYGHRVPTS